MRGGGCDFFQSNGGRVSTVWRSVYLTIKGIAVCFRFGDRFLLLVPIKDGDPFSRIIPF